MKIIIDGFIYTFAPSGGGYRYFNELISRLSKFPDTEVNIFTPKDPIGLPTDSEIKIAKDNFPTGKWLPEGKIKNHLRAAKKLIQRRLLEKKFSGVENSVYHSTYYTPSPWKGLPQVTTVYDMISEIFPETFELSHIKYTREVKSQAIKSSNRIIAISETTKKDIQKVYGTDSSLIDVIHLGVDYEFFSQSLTLDSKQAFLQKHKLTQPFFLYVGGRLHHKNFTRFLTAFAASKVSKDYYLVAAGTPWTGAEIELIDSLNLKNKITLLTGMTDLDLAYLYQSAVAFVFPSYYEGFGLPLIEAMAAGCPVLASNAGPFPELAEQSALLFDPFDEHNIGQALEQILNNNLRTQLINSGKKRALHFSWDDLAQKHLVTYQKAING